MMTMITNRTQDERGISVEAFCGNKSAFIYIAKNYISVVCNNASHRVFRGTGRMFKNFDEALEAYQSSEMKNIIEAAREVA